MMKPIGHMILCGLMLCVSALPAHAVNNDEPPPVNPDEIVPGKSTPGAFDLFKVTDKDTDGMITLKEQTDQAGEYFDRLDTDKDGTLTLEELHVRAGQVLDVAKPDENPDQHKQAVDQRARRHFSAIDTDHDGKVARDEYLDRARARHKMMDTNGDGNVDRAEFDLSRKRNDQRRRDMFRKMKEERAAQPAPDQSAAQPSIVTPAQEQ